MTRRGRKITRSVVLFAGGLLGVALETLYSLRYHQTPDSTLVLLFSAMMGLPVYLAQDRGRDDGDSTPPEKDPREDKTGGRHGSE